MGTVTAKYTIGHIVRHRVFPFRGVVFDIDPQFDNSEEWYESISPSITSSLWARADPISHTSLSRTWCWTRRMAPWTIQP